MGISDDFSQRAKPREHFKQPTKRPKSRQRLTLEILEDRFAPAVVINGTEESNDIRVFVDDDLQGTIVLVTIDGETVFANILAEVPCFEINGLEGDDTLTVDFFIENPIPVDGIDFDGGDGNDEIILQGNTGTNAFTTEAYTYDNATDGSIEFINGAATSTINYTALEPIINTGTPANIIFNLPNVGNQATLENDPSITGWNQLTPNNGTFEFTNFVSPTNSLTINGGTDSDTIIVTSLDDTYSADTFINTGDGIDSVIVLAVPAATAPSASFFVDGEAGVDDLIWDAGGPMIAQVTLDVEVAVLIDDINSTNIDGTATIIDVITTDAEIQDAIDIAASGATITVSVGAYFEPFGLNIPSAVSSLTLRGATGIASDVVIITSDPSLFDGVTVSSDNLTLQAFTITNSRDGIVANTATLGALTVDNVVSTANTSNGLNLSDISLVTLTNTTATSNGANGFVGSSLMTLNDTNGDFSFNAIDGITLDNSGSVGLDGTIAFLNMGNGIDLQGNSGEIQVIGTVIQGNNSDGVGTGDGLRVTDAGNNLTVLGATIDGTNGIGGPSTQTNGVFVDGINGSVTIGGIGADSVSVINNVERGATIQNQLNPSTQSVIVNEGIFNSNGTTGFEFQTVGSVAIGAATAAFNDGNGFDVMEPMGQVNVIGTVIQGNNNDGVGAGDGLRVTDAGNNLTVLGATIDGTNGIGGPSTQTNGVFVDGINGSVTIGGIGADSVSVINNVERGATIQNQLNPSTQSVIVNEGVFNSNGTTGFEFQTVGSVAVGAATASFNQTDNGFRLQDTRAVNMINATATNNGSSTMGLTGGDGLFIENTNGGSVVIDGGSYSVNRGDGIDINAAGAVTIRNATNASQNQGNGICIDNVWTVNIENSVTANLNVENGICIMNVTGMVASMVPASVTLFNSITANQNGKNGIKVMNVRGADTTKLVASVTMDNSITANQNQENGIYITMVAGADTVPVSLTNSVTANQNTLKGILINDIAGVSSATITLQNSVTANQNMSGGVTLEDITGSVTLDTLTVNQNKSSPGLEVRNIDSFQDKNGIYAENDDGGLILQDIANDVILDGTILQNNNANDDSIGDGFQATDGTDDPDFLAIGGSLEFNNVISQDTSTASGMTMNQIRGVFVTGVGGHFTDTFGNYFNNADGGIVLQDISGDVTLSETILQNNNANNDDFGDGFQATDGTDDSDLLAIGGNVQLNSVISRDTNSANGMTMNQIRGVFINGVGGFFNDSGGIYTRNADGGIVVEDITTDVLLTGTRLENNDTDGDNVGAGFQATDGTDDLDLVAVGGNVTLQAVTSSDSDLTDTQTQQQGVFVDGVGGFFSDTDGFYSDNTDGGVVLVDITLDVTLNRTVLLDNNADGDAIGNGFQATDGIDDPNSSAIDGNLVIRDALILDTDGTNTNHSQVNGVTVDSVGLDVVFGEVTGGSLFVTGHDNIGVTIDTIGGSFTDINGTYSENTNGGIVLGTVGVNVTLSGTTLENNDTGDDNDAVGDGFHVTMIGNDLLVEGTTIRGTMGADTMTQQNGIVVGDIGGNVTIGDPTISLDMVTGHVVDGVRIENADGATMVVIQNTTANNNDNSGIALENVGPVVLEGVTATDNVLHGVFVNGAGPVTVNNSSFESNVDGLNITGASTITLEATSANNNDNDGIGLNNVGPVFAEGVTAASNQRHGLYVNEAGPVTIHNSSFEDNTDGINIVNAEGLLKLGAVTTTSNRDDGLEVTSVMPFPKGDTTVTLDSGFLSTMNKGQGIDLVDTLLVVLNAPTILGNTVSSTIKNAETIDVKGTNGDDSVGVTRTNLTLRFGGVDQDTIALVTGTQELSVFPSILIDLMATNVQSVTPIAATLEALVEQARENGGVLPAEDVTEIFQTFQNVNEVLFLRDVMPPSDEVGEGKGMSLSPQSLPQLAGVLGLSLTGGSTETEPRFGPFGVDDSLTQLANEYGFRGASSFYQNGYGFEEKWFLDKDGAWVSMTPDGWIFRWDGISGSLGTQISKTYSAVYKEPELLFKGTLLFTLDEARPLSLESIADQTTSHNVPLSIELNATGGSDNPRTYSAQVESYSLLHELNKDKQFRVSGSYHFNATGWNEKWLWSDKDEGWYVLFPNGDLHAYPNNSFGKRLANVGTETWADPSLLHAALPPASHDVSVDISGNLLTFTPQAGKSGTYKITATVSDGPVSESQTFLVTTTNSAPVFDEFPEDQVVSHNVGELILDLAASDADREAVSYETVVKGWDELSDWNERLGLYQFVGSYYTNYLGDNEKWLRSDVEDRWYVLLENGDFHPVTGTELEEKVASFGPEVWSNPTLLHEAIPPANPPVKTAVAQGQLVLDIPQYFLGTFRVEVTATDGSTSTTRSFLVTTTNQAPEVDLGFSELTLSQDDFPYQMTLETADADNDTLTYDVKLAEYTMTYALDREKQFGMLGGSYHENYLGFDEKWIRSYTENRWYVLTKNGDLYHSDGQAIVGTPIASLGSQVWDDPTLLHKASEAQIEDFGWSVFSDTLTLTLPSIQHGTFEVTIQVSDRTGVTEKRFLLTVD
ncbi:MAG: beta strand repeat-containing protein [Gemmataceae bacterium]